MDIQVKLREVPLVLLRESGEIAAWDVYFACVVSMMLHPGHEGRFNLDAASQLVDEMMEFRRQRIA